MKIELLGALDYAKLEELLKNKVENSEEIIEEIKRLEKERRASIVSTAGRLSRFAGDIFEVLGLSESKSFDANLKFIKRVTSMGHDSITDHDYCVFAIKDVSPVIEQTIITERFCSFTIKSRREVDFSQVGYYTPDFHDLEGNLLQNNEEVKREYQEYMESLFKKYEEFVRLNVPKEDARFILPYCYHSNILMGIDAHVLKDMIIKFTKTKYAKISELREFGEKLYEIAKEHVPYIIDEIEKEECNEHDAVDDYLKDKIKNGKYEILTNPKLLKHTDNIDDTILVTSIMRRYQLDYESAVKAYHEICKKYPNFKEQLMRKIAFESNKLELTQVNFQFQIPLSFAVLTHLTRHRTHDILVPDFVPVVDLSQFKIPPKIKGVCLESYQEVFKNNQRIFEHFKNDYNIREEDLIYFTLSGNMVNIITNMNGKTLEHILRLRECTKAQWETREMAIGMHAEIDRLLGAEVFSSILGPTCVTQGFCKEGKESCGRILKLQSK